MSSLYIRGKRKIYWLAFVDNGKRFYKSLKTRDKHHAEFLQKQHDIAQEQNSLNPTKRKLTDVLEEYKQASFLKRSKIACHSDMLQLDTFKNACKCVYLSDIKPSHIQGYLAALSSRKPKTINNYIGNIKAFLNFCVKRRYLAYSPAETISKIKVAKNPPRFLNKEEIKKLIEAAKESHLYPIIIIALYTGMRISEILNLEWKDVTDVITVRGDKSKSKRFRIIPIHPELKKLLDKMSKKNNLVLGKVYSYRHLLRGLKEVYKNAGIAEAGWHITRHSFASNLVINNTDLLTISKLLGHSSVAVTEIYSHLTTEHLQKSVEKLTFS